MAQRLAVPDPGVMTDAGSRQLVGRSGSLARSGSSHVGTGLGSAEPSHEGHGADERIRTSTPEGTGT